MKIRLIKNPDTGCITPISHKLNEDGYFRKYIDGRLIMYHRYIWEEQNQKKVPEGYEINHLCRNRACCNINHLEVLIRRKHLILTNKNRYRQRKETANKYWKEYCPTGTKLAEIFGVSFGTGCKWIREFKSRIGE